MRMVGLVELILLGLPLLIVITVVVKSLQSRDTDSSTHAAAGVNLNCPHCGQPTAANRPSCEHCKADL